MASRKLPNYLRSYRKRAGLSQNEVGFLLGGLSGDCVSTHERFRKQPGPQGILAYEILFGAPCRELFAGAAQDIERGVRERAQQLVERLAQTNSRRNVRKAERLRAIASGASPVTSL